MYRVLFRVRRVCLPCLFFLLDTSASFVLYLPTYLPVENKDTDPKSSSLSLYTIPLDPLCHNRISSSVPCPGRGLRNVRVAPNPRIQQPQFSPLSLCPFFCFTFSAHALQSNYETHHRAKYAAQPPHPATHAH